ncbi:retrovirus-related pol polyprotein from transposon TNT 1-94 [Tanacetum coccineum]
MTISKLKDKIKTIEKGKNMNAKFDKSETLGKLLCLTPLNTNTSVKAKKVSNAEVKADRSKPITSHSTPKNEQSVESSNSVRRPQSKDNKSKKRVLKNTNIKTTSTNVRNFSSSVSIVSNKRESMSLIVSQSNANVFKAKTYLRLKRALFTSHVASKSRNLGATFVVAKSRFSVAKTPTATNKVIQLVLWIVDSGCSKHMTGNLYLVRNFLEKFIGTVRFENDHFTAITRYGDYVQGNLTICHGEDLLTGSRDSNLYTISISKLAASSPAKAIATACFTQNCSLVHTWYNKTPYELIKGRRTNVQYFHVFESRCYPTNDRDGLGKMKPKADIGIFIGNSDSSRGFRIYNRQTKKIMKTIHVNFDELTAMASECNNSGLVLNDSAANTLPNKDSPSYTSIVIEENEASQIATSSEEPVANKPITQVSNQNSNELVQEDVAAINRNDFYNPFCTSVLKEVESSSTFQDPSNMHEFYQKHHSTD